MRIAVLLAACVLAAPMLAGELAPKPTPALALQADVANPLWGALRDLHVSQARWATLLTGDADHNGRTDFLDVLTAAAATRGQLATPVELLVHGDAAARQALVARVPGAVDVPAAEGVFLTAALGDVASLQVPGVSIIAFEPRAYVASSTNPAGGSPSAMPQIAIHQGGAAWTAGYTGSGVKVAVFDTGADTGHQALSGTGKVSSFKDCTSAATSSYDDHGHGTHVASIVAGDDGTDFRGLAYQATLVIVKVLDAAGSGSLAGFQCGINWVRNVGGTVRADVATMSAGLGVPPLGLTTLNGGEEDLFGWDRVAEILPLSGHIPFTIAAGNWIGTGVEIIGADTTTHAGVNGVNQVSSPGFATAVVTVGAVDQYGAPATFTALGPGKLGGIKPDVAAQGVLTWGALKGTTSFYEQWDGTSMATPLAAGAIALLMDKTSGLAHTTYENALRNGAAQGCVLNTGSCLLAEQPDPNFVDGNGVVKASASLALV